MNQGISIQNTMGELLDLPHIMFDFQSPRELVKQVYGRVD